MGFLSKLFNWNTYNKEEAAFFEDIGSSDDIQHDSLCEYVVLDIETTGFSHDNDSIIEVAVIRVHNNKIVGCYETLINPGTHIPSRITQTTGIKDRDVANAPTLDSVLPDVFLFIGNSIVVGHNITFDLSFLYAKSMQLYGEGHCFQYIDTLGLSRDCFPWLNSHSLDSLINALGLAEQQTHRAMDDVICTHKLFLECLARTEQSFADISLKTYNGCTTKRKRRSENFSPKMLTPPTASVNPAHPLFKKSVVLTGEMTIPRRDIAQMVVDVGGLIKSSVSTKTDYLAVGKQDTALVGADGMSSKEERAYIYNKSGAANISIVDEATLMRLIAGEAVDITPPLPSTPMPSSQTLLGKCVVFVGTFSRSREDLGALAECAGARLSGSISAKTDYLVVGSRDVTQLDENGMGTKDRKAHLLNESNQANITIVDEDEFIRILYGQEVLQ